MNNNIIIQIKVFFVNLATLINNFTQLLWNNDFGKIILVVGVCVVAVLIAKKIITIE